MHCDSQIQDTNQALILLMRLTRKSDKGGVVVDAAVTQQRRDETIKIR
jgi:hypothetical protein